MSDLAKLIKKQEEYVRSLKEDRIALQKQTVDLLQLSPLDALQFEDLYMMQLEIATIDQTLPGQEIALQSYAVCYFMDCDGVTKHLNYERTRLDQLNAEYRRTMTYTPLSVTTIAQLSKQLREQEARVNAVDFCKRIICREIEYDD